MPSPQPTDRDSPRRLARDIDDAGFYLRALGWQAIFAMRIPQLAQWLSRKLDEKLDQ